MVSDRTLKAISIIFYPTNIAIPFIVVFSLGNIFEMMLAFIFISIIPFFLTAHYAKKRNINIDIFEQDKRHIPFIMSLASFALGVLVFKYLNSPLLYTLCLACLNIAIAFLVINTKWKISVHSAGIAGAATYASYVFGWIATPLFLLVPFIGWVRYKVDAHDLYQIIGGITVSIVISFLTFSAFYPV